MNGTAKVDDSIRKPVVAAPKDDGALRAIPDAPDANTLSWVRTTPMIYEVRMGISILSNELLIRKRAIANVRVGMKGIENNRIFVGRCVNSTAFTAPTLLAIFPPTI